MTKPEMRVGKDGRKRWLLNGKMHRTDGPAIVRSDGSRSWWLNDRHYTFNKWLIAIDASDEDRTWLKIIWG